MVLSLLLSFSSLGQAGDIRGVITDAATERTIPFTRVTLHTTEGDLLLGTESDIEGVYRFSVDKPGKYILKFNSMMHDELVISGVIVLSDRITFQNAQLNELTY